MKDIQKQLAEIAFIYLVKIATDDGYSNNVYQAQLAIKEINKIRSDNNLSVIDYELSDDWKW